MTDRRAAYNARLATALRENLKRRKTADRASSDALAAPTVGGEANNAGGDELRESDRRGMAGPKTTVGDALGRPPDTAGPK